MTKKEKRLLAIELCARVPYGVICTDNHHGDSRVFNVDVEDESVYYTDFDEYGLIKNCKPYLRPMSSMTEEEKREVEDLSKRWIESTGIFIWPNEGNNVLRWNTIEVILDWLNEHHFDYRGLIEKGLAIEAPEDMYKNQKV